MKKIILSLSILAVTFFAGCNPAKKGDADTANVIGKPEVKIENGKFTPEVMWGMGKLGQYSISPDGKQVIYTNTYYSIEENKGNAEIYLMNVDGSALKQLTKTPKSEFEIQWNPNGKRIGFLRGTEKGAQFFEMDADGKNEKQITDIEGGLEGFKYSPDASSIFYIKTIRKNREMDTLYAGLDKATGRINEDLMYRHWDEWVDAIPHVFVAKFDGKSLSNDTDVLAGEPYESPMRPWGGSEQIAWSPDGKNIAYTCRKKKGKEYALSTNSDIYIYNIETKAIQNISEGMMGYDQNPVYSPDGKKIAWESMERDGYEADKIRLFVYDFDTKEKTYLTEKFDQNAAALTWTPDNQAIYFISPWHGVEDVYKIKLQDKSIERITTGVHDYTGIRLANNNLLIGSRNSMSVPAELYAIEPDAKKETQISAINTEVLKQVKMGKVEERWIETADKKQMLTWVIYPPDFDSTKTYPTILYCQGGPQSMVSQFWSTRWNFQIMASAGYIVVAPNRRGVPGFGQAWNEAISGDYGGLNQQDYLSAIDAVSKEKYVDANRLGAVGASYGGFSVYWLAGHHNKRFKAFIAHNGMFNLEQQYLETEELWFTNWDLGGAFWEKDNKIAQRSFANSPHKFVDKWDTPILVIHSELDYRIVASQGMAAYNAAVMRGIPARYLYFPDENHWVLQPQNSILWHRNFIDWLDKWLK